MSTLDTGLTLIRSASRRVALANHWLGNAFKQVFLIHLIGQLIHNNGLALALVHVFKMSLGAHHDAASSSAIPLAHSLNAINDSGGREIGCWNNFD